MADHLDPHRWSEADRIFDEALERPVAERKAFIDEACRGDSTLRQAVRRLLDAHEAAEGFLDEPPALPPPDGLSDLTSSHLEPSLVGQSVGPYGIVRRVGRGGMGAVFLAERADGRYEAQVALKFLHVGVAGDDLTQRFLSERRILATLTHPNIARLLDAGETSEGWPYLVMEFVEGEPITRYADRHQLTVDQRLELFFQVCHAVEYAHDRMVIHRDLKPSNVLVDTEGRVKLLDFGIAKLLDDTAAEDEPLTRPGTRVLTPEYAAPEQLRGDPATAATDVHQLGALLHRLLVGRRPFASREDTAPPASTRETERAILQDEPHRPSGTAGMGADPEAVRREAEARSTDPDGLRRRLRGDLDAILLTALRKAPEDRYRTVSAFRRDLERHLDGFPVRARPPTLSYRGRKLLQRRWGWAAAVVGVLVAGGAFLHAQASYQAELQAERDRALQEEERARATADFLVSLFHDVDPAEGAADTLSAVSLVNRGTVRARDAFTDDPELRAYLLGAVGRAHLGLGTGERAWQLLLEADSLLQELQGPNDPDRLALMEDLAWNLVVANQFERGQSLWEDLLERRRKEAQTGGLDATLALAAVKRGAARNMAGLEDRDDGEVRRLAERALEMYEETGEEGSLAHLRAQTDLAMVLRVTGEPDSAEVLYRDAANRHEEGQVERGSLWEEGVGVGGGGVIRTPGTTASIPTEEERERRWSHERSAHLAETYNALGVLLSISDDADERAEEIRDTYRRSYEVSRKAWGETHDRTLNAHRNLAAGYTRVGDSKGDLDLRREALELKVERFGPRHWRVGRSHADKAQVYHEEMGDPVRAEEHHREAVAIYTEDLGDHHEWTATARTRLAFFLADQGRQEEGVALLTDARRSLEEAEDRAGVTAPLHITLEALQELHLESGDTDAADEAREALENLAPN